MRQPHRSIYPFLVAALCAGCSDVSEPPAVADGDAEPTEAEASLVANLFRTPLAGGATTVFDTTADAFGHPAPNLGAENLARHEEGDEGFADAFDVARGLGPVFDNVSCETCHVGDGRGRPPTAGEAFESMLFRSSIPGRNPHGGPNPIPGFGGQLQLRAIPNVQPEVEASIAYAESTGTFTDGSTFSLRVPRYSFANSYAPLPSNFLFSPRTAPFVFGLGLLEAVPEYLLRALADENDRDLDGISGRVNLVFDERLGTPAVGRFGWKANTPNLFQQAAGAYNGDMGVTSSLFPAESCEGRAYEGCAPHAVEVDDEVVQNVALYTRTLAVPARRDLDNLRVRAGELLFVIAGCIKCHTPTLYTGVLDGVPEVSRQVIHPYTDLLVHDMGLGLADGRPDFRTSGSEWRTAPLWGIGLIEKVNGHTNFMHDGRARSVLEAVMWHGGEATRARERVRRMTAGQRSALVAFLLSL